MKGGTQSLRFVGSCQEKEGERRRGFPKIPSPPPLYSAAGLKGLGGFQKVQTRRKQKKCNPFGRAWTVVLADSR